MRITDMWQMDTYWFDVALAMTVFMLGHLFFGRFVEHRSRWRRLLKTVFGVAILIGTTTLAGRGWMLVLLSAIVVGLGVIHGWWLPRKGVNGWTAEPRARYYELIGEHPTDRSP